MTLISKRFTHSQARETFTAAALKTRSTAINARVAAKIRWTLAVLLTPTEGVWAGTQTQWWRLIRCALSTARRIEATYHEVSKMDN